MTMALERVRGRLSDRSSTRKAPAEIDAEAIAQRAYEKFLARGGRHGDDLRDWFEAEKELKAEIGQN
jgi:hypothetical protein